MLGLPLLVLAVLMPRTARAKTAAAADTSSRSTSPHATRRQKIQQVVDRVRGHLAIPDPVSVALVRENRLIVSVSRAEERDRGFHLSLEEDFVAELSDVELEAVVAHELGHVWIFTHHPYLQTEEGANTVALRIVDRKALEDVYDKVWTRVGGRGSISYLPNEH